MFGFKSFLIPAFLLCVSGCCSTQRQCTQSLPDEIRIGMTREMVLERVVNSGAEDISANVGIRIDTTGRVRHAKWFELSDRTALMLVFEEKGASKHTELTEIYSGDKGMGYQDKFVFSEAMEKDQNSHTSYRLPINPR
jgi:hypothetical protein